MGSPDLPNLLVIGDSVSLGWTLPLRNLMNGTYNVFRVPANARSSAYTTYFLRQWLGLSKEWSIILVNHGLHECVLENGMPRHSVEFYASSLREEFEILRQTGAKVVFLTSTPLPPENYDRAPIEPYNEVAVEEANRQGIDIIDLYSFVLDAGIPHINLSNVHFSSEASFELAVFIYEYLISKLSFDDTDSVLE